MAEENRGVSSGLALPNHVVCVEEREGSSSGCGWGGREANRKGTRASRSPPRLWQNYRDALPGTLRSALGRILE